MARRRAGAVVLALVALVGVSALGAGTATADPLPGASTADGLKTTGFQLLGGHADAVALPVIPRDRSGLTS